MYFSEYYDSRLISLFQDLLMAYLIMASYQIWREPNKISIKLSRYQLLGRRAVLRKMFGAWNGGQESESAIREL